MARLPSKRGVRAGPGSETAHAVVNLLRGKIPVNSPVFFFQDRAHRLRFRFLRGRRNFSAVESQKRLGDKFRADGAHARGQFRRGFVRADFDFAAQERRPGIHARIDLHGGEPGEGFAVGDGPVDRRGAAITRQQGPVQINPAEAGNC